MNSSDWKKVIATVAPTLATALGGPLAGIAVGALAKGLLPADAAPSEEAVATAVAQASPDTLLKLKQLEADFAKSLQDAGVKLEEITASDRASAREREKSVKDKTPAIMAYAVTVGFFGVLGWLLKYGKPELGGDALLVMLGSLGTAWTAIISYFYGSSAGSAQKTEALAAMAHK